MARLPRVAVAIPAYNEECLDEFLAEIEHHLRPHCEVLSFVVVDDCSSRPLPVPAGTTCLPLGSTLEVLRNETNQGHGPTAVRAWTHGLSRGVDIVIHVDGDGQFLGEDFPRLLAATQGRDGAVGTRMGRREPWFRRILTVGARILVGQGFRGIDANSPMRAYRATVVARLLDALPEGSAVPHLQFALSHTCLELDVVEIGVTHRSRRGDSSVGSTWRSRSSLQLLPSRQLIRLTLRAIRELRAGPTNVGEPNPRVSLVNDAA
jgi:glycosyltransferase involved in cell wall biosynthesis